MQLWDRVIDELLRIRNLEDDYDGEGTEAPAPALVDGAIRLAKSFREERSTPPDRVHAGVNATVYFEWFTSVGYGELEIVSPVQAEGRFLKTGSSMPEIYNVTI